MLKRFFLEFDVSVHFFWWVVVGVVRTTYIHRIYLVGCVCVEFLGSILARGFGKFLFVGNDMITLLSLALPLLFLLLLYIFAKCWQTTE